MLKKMVNALLVVGGLMVAGQAWAHEGHDMPGTVKSIYGGVVKTGKLAHIEYVTGEGELKIYPITHEGESLPKDLEITAKAQPKKGAAYDLVLTKKDKFFATAIDMKGANRLPVTITFKSGAKSDQFKIQVEAE